MKKEDYTVPVIIRNWIDGLNDQATPHHIKENYAQMLGNVHEACGIEIAKFRLRQNQTVPRKKGR